MLRLGWASRALLVLALLCDQGALPAWASDDEFTLDAKATTDESQDDQANSENWWSRLLPLPIFITEPAIGEGLGASLIYFHRDEETEQPRAATARDLGNTARRSKPPPTATGIFGFYTNSDSAAVGIGHSNSFDDDTYRLVAAGAEARINSQLYIADRGFDFRIEGSLLYSQVKYRLGREGAFAGLSLSYLDADTRFFTGLPELDDLDLLRFGFQDAGAALSLLYDTRDNTILPSSGFLLDLTAWRHDESLGGDFNYNKAGFKGLYFFPLADKYALGLRLDVDTASGDVPFYAAPYVSLRGIPALRYQGRTVGAVEIEARRRLADRWTASIFTGLGYVDSGFEFGKTEDDIYNYGIGLRYLAFREQDAWVGVDIAQGPEDTAWYIQVGSSW